MRVREELLKATEGINRREAADVSIEQTLVRKERSLARVWPSVEVK